MKNLMMISLLILSCEVLAKDKVATKAKVAIKKNETKAMAKVEAPCDSKEDLIKKLEEKKKAEGAASKAFSLQGGDTGCKVK